MDIDPSLLQAASPLAYILVFAGGVVSSIGSCNMAMIPLIIGYVGGSRRLSRGRALALSLTFATGLAITFMLLGVIASLVGRLIGGTTRLWYYVVAAVCLLIGLHMLGALTLPQVGGPARLRERIVLQGAPGALALGLVSGLVASQCATPACGQAGCCAFHVPGLDKGSVQGSLSHRGDTPRRGSSWAPVK